MFVSSSSSSLAVLWSSVSLKVLRQFFDLTILIVGLGWARLDVYVVELKGVGVDNSLFVVVGGDLQNQMFVRVLWGCDDASLTPSQSEYYYFPGTVKFKVNFEGPTTEFWMEII